MGSDRFIWNYCFHCIVLPLYLRNYCLSISDLFEVDFLVLQSNSRYGSKSLEISALDAAPWNFRSAAFAGSAKQIQISLGCRSHTYCHLKGCSVSYLGDFSSFGWKSTNEQRWLTLEQLFSSSENSSPCNSLLTVNFFVSQLFRSEDICYLRIAYFLRFLQWGWALVTLYFDILV